MRRILGIMLVAVSAVLLCGTVGSAQTRPNRGRAGAPALPEGAVSPAEIQRLFDAYVVMQAQTELQLSDEQFGPFLTRVRALQEARRTTQVERNRLLQAIRRLIQGAGAEAEMRTQLKTLAELDARAEAQVRQAHEAIDQVLTVPQQARFRLFEDAMERRKVDLLVRARQQQRQQQRQQN